MSYLRLIWQTIRHYSDRNLLVVFGVALSTAVLVGALIIGDSVRYSLEQTTFFRLGNTTHLVSTNDRFFRSALASDLQKHNGYVTAPVLMLEGIAVTDGGLNRVNKVQVIGIDDNFEVFADDSLYTQLKDNEVIVSENLASKLNLQTGNSVQVRIEKASLIPRNAPFVSEEQTSVTVNATVKSIVGRSQLSNFNLKNSQQAPYNLFISLMQLNRLMDFNNRANRILVNGQTDIGKLNTALNECILPADGGLIFKHIPLTGENEITTERIFIERSVTDAFANHPGIRKILTYFVNRISFAGTSTPYSFVSSLSDEGIKPDEIIINQWTSDDLKITTNDTLELTYFEIGPLRQLNEKTISLKVKRIVAINGRFADVDMMPRIPGLSDAGHCREWEAGVPVKLDEIRPKDEAYWSTYKGTPKAFVSPELASKIWANRFGDYTALRFEKNNFREADFEQIFKQHISPGDLGFSVQAVRDDGLAAARNGVDFSQLFLGLSFFLLLSAIILTIILFKLNLETRSAQIGTLLQLGFRKMQVAKILFFEAMAISILGVGAGLLLALGYTKLIFYFLNTLWWEIVRTSVLFIHIYWFTIIIGALISLLISVIAIAFPLRRFLVQKVAGLHKNLINNENPKLKVLKTVTAIVFIATSLVILALQLYRGGSQNPLLFFTSGGLLLAGLILFSELVLAMNWDGGNVNFNRNSLMWRNLSQNKSRSLSVIILFALGTFIVISTGANRQDMLLGAGNKTSGTGGFRFFAETSIPLLYDLNDPARRLSEGLTSDFRAVQFHRIDGDDASCLNLNRISNPALLGVNAEELSGRFKFVTNTAELDAGDAWLSLDKALDGNVIPAIADQTVIQWGMGMKVGDTLLYQAENGDTLRLKLIGGLAPSIFQGNVIISNKHFLKGFPTHSGSSVFLIESDEVNSEFAGNELSDLLRDYGFEMTDSAQKLVEFSSVTNTYLSIFLALGALALALGTIGLALVLARSILERRREMAVMLAVGYSRHNIVNRIFAEYSVLLTFGVGAGFISAVIAVLPALVSDNNPVKVWTISLLVTAIIVNGFFWIYGSGMLWVKSKNLVPALRDE